jgi:hypothetical protein
LPDAPEAARERRRIHSRANQMQRAQAAVVLSLDALTVRERLVVLNELMTELLAAYREAQALADNPGA